MVLKDKRSLGILMVGSSCLFGSWTLGVLVGGLHQVNWQVTELMRQCLVASGLIQPIHCMVDFYTHIKGIEYIICVAFFVAFPVFFRYVDKRKTHVTTSVTSE